jgi:hypothetical protein
MSLRVILFYCAGVVVLGGAGWGTYSYFNTGSDDVAAEVKIAGPQASGQNVTVYDARIDASAVNFGTEEIVNAGYTATTYINLRSSKKMAKVALEDLKIDNLSAIGDCSTSDKDASVDTYIPNMDHFGYISFKETCRTGVSYSVDSVLATSGEWSGSKLLSYAGLTPEALTRSLTFDVAVKFEDGTMTKKSFSGKINGSVLFKGDFGAGSLSGSKDKF